MTETSMSYGTSLRVLRLFRDFPTTMDLLITTWGLLAVSDHPKCWETWDGLRTFPWREFGILLEEMIPFAA